jgi:hypothetical protein
LYLDLPIAAGLAEVPFDFGTFRLGGWIAIEVTVHEPVTGVHMTGRDVANGGRCRLEDLACVTFAKVDARQRGQLRWGKLFSRPALSLRAERFAIHVEVVALTNSCPFNGVF